MSDQIRVLVVDDHPLVRSGLSQLLNAADGIDVVAAVESGREAVESVGELAPDLVLMDVSMPGMDGVAAAREILRRRPSTRIVMLTSYAEDQTVLAAIDAGASGYLLKDAEPEELVRAVRAAARGESPLAPRAARAVLASRSASSQDGHLTPREEEVLDLVGEGLPNKQIARRLGISEKTVKTHLTSVFQRIGVLSRTEAAIWWRDRRRRS
jgi:DNA-binding NarL/FixJ family response regulator